MNPFKEIKRLYYLYKGRLFWKRYEKMGCFHCKLRYKNKPWCVERRKNKHYRKCFCVRFKYGFSKKR